MTKYRVSFAAVANAVVEVEADSREQALDLAYEQTPTPNIHWPEVGDWELVSDLFPDWATEAEAIEEIE